MRPCQPLKNFLTPGSVIYAMAKAQAETRIAQNLRANKTLKGMSTIISTIHGAPDEPIESAHVQTDRCVRFGRFHTETVGAKSLTAVPWSNQAVYSFSA